GLVAMHVALGVMQNDRNPFITAMLASGFAIVTLLHLVVGWRERLRDGASARCSDGWLAVGPAVSIPGTDPRGLRSLAVRRLPRRGGGRLRAAAVHREARHLPRAHCAWRGRGRPAPPPARDAGRDNYEWMSAMPAVLQSRCAHSP